MLRFRTAVSLAGACLIATAAPAAAQFADVPQPPAPTPYAIRFGRDTAAPPPAQRDSIRAAARAELRAWVDSAALNMGIDLDLPDSVEFPLDSAAIDSLAPEIGPENPQADSARRDSVRRDSVRRDSVRRDSVRRDSVRRAGPPPVTSAMPARPPRPAPEPHRSDRRRHLAVLAPSSPVPFRPR